MSRIQRSARAAVIAAAAVLVAPVLAAAPAAAEDKPATDCPDIHILAVQPTAQTSVDAPSDSDSGELAGVIVPVLEAARSQDLSIERTYVSYPADSGSQGLSAAYKSSVVDGYQRLAQVAARVIYQCKDTKLVILGNGQGGQAASTYAKQVATGKAGTITSDNIALVVTWSDPTRAAGAPLFANKPGQVAPASWPGLDQKKQPSATKFPDMYVSPTGQGIGPDRDITASFGGLDGRVAQFCINGDLSCSAPKSISLAKVALGIAGQSSLDFSHDPFGVAAQLATATANTLANGLGTFAAKDVKGSSLADVYFDSKASISQRLADAADSTNTTQQTNPLVGVLKLGQIVMSSVTSFVGTVLNSSTLTSLISAGAQVLTSAASGAVSNAITASVAGPEAALAAAGLGAATGAASTASGLLTPVITLGTNALSALINIVPPQSASTKISSIFDLLINEVTNNSDLPAVITDARLWNNASTNGGYRTTRVAQDGSTPADITADWVIAAARDYKAARVAAAEAKKPKDHDAPAPTKAYDKDKSGKPTAPTADRPDLSTVIKKDTPNDVRIINAPTPTGTVTPTTATPITWLPDGATSIAARLAALTGDGPATILLRLASPVLAATTATSKDTPK
ncbi:cutinase family protein [Nocardia tengchongensis]|uniref:cutinase family protein n=1 Tax=Nocardia tengchongensis TaxID=2055889 RepID=UPI0036AD9074